ncbi:FAD-binding domain-containing protein [Byssothecium circinans]|uniref:FAD-binding domain-containing protein n=1 Tax=Byssothecium circinans TaxID=147558 RepID=A0A6A5UA96_9PLEO|nr:FAD-binding domain-containing protein [Byssothecium circinans]
MVRSLVRWFSLLCLSQLANSAPLDLKDILDQLNATGACCTALQYFLPGKVVLPTDINYLSSQTSFWSGQEQSLHPTCIVIPTSTQDVSTAVTVLSTGYQASISGCKFAVRGGGHTPHAGAANIEGGVTIDMQSMNHVNLSDDRKSVSIGPGNRWGNVYGILDEQNLAMIGGRVSSVGAAGLLTGGGVSFFSGRYGFACNNIQSYEVVLGNGTVVTASSTQNPSLFRALKGGGNNFGIATRFDAKVYPQSSFWGGQITQPITNKEAYFDFMANFTRSATYDPYAALFSNFLWVEGAPSVLLQYTVYSNGEAAWPPPAFASLDAMPKLLTTVRKEKLSSFTNEISSESTATKGLQNAFVTTSIVNNPDVSAEYMSRAWELSDIAVKELVLVVGIAFTLTYQPLPQVLYSKDSSSNVLGLDRFRDDLINILFVVTWTLPTDNERVYARLQRLENDLVALAENRGIANEWLYLNYAAQWQKPIASYGTANVAFLKGVSKSYDPAGIFQNAVPGGFKLDI